MGEKDLHEYWSETWKTHTMKWTKEEAGKILSEWQRRFSEEVEAMAREREEGQKRTSSYDLTAFSASQLDAIMEKFAEFSWTRMAAGFAVMVREIANFVSRQISCRFATFLPLKKPTLAKSFLKRLIN